MKIEKSHIHAPCDVLPSELLAEIFKLTSKPPPFCKTPNTNFTLPLLLGAVCHKWHEIAWGLPTLWKYVHLVLSIKHYDVCVDLLEEWLDQAKDCPLHIVFRVPRDIQEEFMEWCDDGPFEMFALFTRKRVQWEKINLDLITQECVASLEECEGELPLLQAVALNDLANGMDIDLLKDSLALCQLSLKGSHHFKFCHLPSCATLTDLYLSSLSIENTISLLQETVNVKSCYLKYIDSEFYVAVYNDEDEEDLPLSFPFLETLVIDGCSSKHMLGLLGKVPKLHDLGMKGMGCPDLPILDQFFKEHDCKLDKFHLTIDTSMKIDKIRQVLGHHSKTLTSLSIYDN
ncbi:unnamed protein product [Cyclocybe aegerita]|uniref:F-box domain-containing protein n=1 Tax=Cyclocybe aegerita TaxID=1973307 RepID=A0A8S0VVW2_CYCAE|nr:unnamed protein product [Cyclocybe aegerita]